MSSILYRQRLRDQQARQAAKAAPNFTPATPGPSPLPLTEPDVLGSQINVVSSAPVDVVPPAPTEQQPVPYEQPAVIPQSLNTTGMSPAAIREHGKTVAYMFAQLPTPEYQASLRNLETSNPVLYSIVVDELNNMDAQAATSEGDGHDLSALTQPQQDAAVTNATPANDLPGE